MSRTRNNTSDPLQAGNAWLGPFEKTNNLATIGVSAIASENSTLTIRQCNKPDGNDGTVTTTFNMLANTSYNFGQIVVSPYFNVSILNLGVDQTFTSVTSVLYPNHSHNSQLQFVNTQTTHMTIQGAKGNFINNVTLLNGDRSAEFNCSTYGNNCVISYQDTNQASQQAVIIQGNGGTDNIRGAAAGANPDDGWCTIGAFTTFVSDGVNRHTFAGVRLAAFSYLRLRNIGTDDNTNVICSVYSS